MDWQDHLGVEDKNFDFGRRIEQISSKKVMLLLKFMGLGGLLYLVFSRSPLGELVGDTEKVVSFAILGAYGMYILYRMTEKVGLHERGFILYNILGSRGFWYNEIRDIEHTYEDMTTKQKMSFFAWFWKTPVAVIYLNHGEEVRFSASTYSNLKQKVQKLEKNLIEK